MKIVASSLVHSLAVATLVALTACTLDSGESAASSGRIDRRADNAAEMTPSLRAAFIRSRQRDAGPEYTIRPRVTVQTASNVAHGFDIAFLEHGITMGPSRGTAWDLTIHLASVGRDESALLRLAASGHASRNEFRYQRPAGITEWYINGPLGLEQGFDLNQRPGGAGTEVVIAMLVGGSLRPMLSCGHIELVDDLDRARLTYSDLYAIDATGRELDARMAVVGKRIELRIRDTDAMYPLTIDPLIARQQAKLIPSDGWPGDRFGGAVGVSGDTAVVGARAHSSEDTDAGAAYVFVRSGTSWTQQAKLVSSAPEVAERFGISVAVSGDTIVIGAEGTGQVQGAAYVFVRNGDTWSDQAQLLASDGAPFDHFGTSVAVSGDSAVIGAPFDDDAGMVSGSAYVFVRNGTTWSEQAKLVASAGTPFAELGASVSISGDTVVAGAYGDEHAGANSGAAHVFTRSGITWSEQARLVASDAAGGDQFGQSVAVSQDTVLVSALGDDDGGSASGAAYVFARNGVTWSEQVKLVASDAHANHFFGSSVAVSAGIAVVGAWGDDSGRGAAYVFQRTGTIWSELGKAVASDAWILDEFGRSVAVDGDTFLVGSHFDDVWGTNSGSAYVFVLVPCGDGVINDDEVCDDGNESDGDGCDASWWRVSDFLCIESCRFRFTRAACPRSGSQTAPLSEPSQRMLVAMFFRHFESRGTAA